MIDPLSATSSIASIIGGVATVAVQVNTLRQRYNHSELNITLSASSLFSVKRALEAIQQLRAGSRDTSAASRQLDEDLSVPLESCAVLITTIERALDGIDVENPSRTERWRFVALNETFQLAERSLDTQVRALQLMLTIYQCGTLAEQTERLNRRDTRRLLHEVKLDTASNFQRLEEQSISDTSSILSEPSVNFTFDRELLQTPMYRAIYRDLYQKYRATSIRNSIGAAAAPALEQLVEETNHTTDSVPSGGSPTVAEMHTARSVVRSSGSATYRPTSSPVTYLPDSTDAGADVDAVAAHGSSKDVPKLQSPARQRSSRSSTITKPLPPKPTEKLGHTRKRSTNSTRKPDPLFGVQANLPFMGIPFEGEQLPDPLSSDSASENEVSIPEQTTHPKQTTHPEQTPQLEQVPQLEQTTQLEQTPQLEQTTQLEQATQLKQTTQLKRLSLPKDDTDIYDVSDEEYDIPPKQMKQNARDETLGATAASTDASLTVPSPDLTSGTAGATVSSTEGTDEPKADDTPIESVYLGNSELARLQSAVREYRSRTPVAVDAKKSQDGLNETTNEDTLQQANQPAATESQTSDGSSAAEPRTSSLIESTSPKLDLPLLEYGSSSFKIDFDQPSHTSSSDESAPVRQLRPLVPPRPKKPSPTVTSATTEVETAPEEPDLSMPPFNTSSTTTAADVTLPSTQVHSERQADEEVSTFAAASPEHLSGESVGVLSPEPPSSPAKAPTANATPIAAMTPDLQRSSNIEPSPTQSQPGQRDRTSPTRQLITPSHRKVDAAPMPESVGIAAPSPPLKTRPPPPPPRVKKPLREPVAIRSHATQLENANGETVERPAPKQAPLPPPSRAAPPIPAGQRKAPAVIDIPKVELPGVDATTSNGPQEGSPVQSSQNLRIPERQTSPIEPAPRLSVTDDASTVGSAITDPRTSGSFNDSASMVSTHRTTIGTLGVQPQWADDVPLSGLAGNEHQRAAILTSLQKNKKEARPKSMSGGMRILRGVSSKSGLTSILGSNEKHTKFKILHQAANAGEKHVLKDYEKDVRRFINGLEKLDELETEKTMLMRTAEGDHLDCMEFLAVNGANFAQVDGNGRIALHYAVQAGAVRATRWLVEHFRPVVSPADHSKPKAALEFPDAHGLRSLHIGARTGHLGIVDILLEYGADVNAADKERRTPLYHAIISGSFEVVERLLRAGAGPHVLDAEYKNPLMWAAEAGASQAVNTLLDLGAQRDCRDSAGNTAIHLAAEGGHLEIIEKLYLTLKDLEAQNHRGERPLHLAVLGDKLHVVRALLTIGCDANAFTKHTLHNRKSNSSWRDRAMAPLHYACSVGAYDPAMALIEHGASVHANLVDGTTPLMLAAKAESAAVCGLMLEHGCNVERKTNKEAMTALHIGLMAGNLDVVQLLAQNGADLRARNRKQQTAWQYATNNGTKNTPASTWLIGYTRRTTTRRLAQQREETNGHYSASQPSVPSPVPSPMPSPMPNMMPGAVLIPFDHYATQTGWIPNAQPAAYRGHIEASARTEEGIEPPPAYSPRRTYG